jgi:GDPmannose 4,6-dehydratase
LKAQRDWGFAPDYVDGMVTMLRQSAVRGVPDEAASYRDYVLGTGELHAVWELADRAFALAGFELEWQLDGEDPLAWSARFAGSGEPAVVVDPAFIRPADPKAIAADPRRVEAELGWTAEPGLDRFLEDMLSDHQERELDHRASDEGAESRNPPAAA